MTTICVEPAEAVGGRYDYLVQVPANDELLFPHVDSCIAIAFVLADGRMIGGHVGMMMPNVPDLNPYGNAMHICRQMLTATGNARIANVLMVGDGNWENEFIGQRNVVHEIQNLVRCPNTLFVDTGAYGGGVDVSLNPRRRMVFIRRCSADRTLVFQRPYEMIHGHQIKRLP
jgi:hypothetical protein